LGGTGAVGSEIVKKLIGRGETNWDKIVLVNRRKTQNVTNDTRIKEYVVDMPEKDFGKMGDICGEIWQKEYGTLLNNSKNTSSSSSSSALFIAMGVGAASKVDEETLRRADLELPSACAKGMKKEINAAFAASENKGGNYGKNHHHHQHHVSLLSAVGADANAKPPVWTFGGLLPKTRAGGGLYNQVKGQVEKNMENLDFPSFSVFRPAALIGTPHTPKIIEWISPVIDKIVPAMFKSSKIDVLASGMVWDAERKLLGGDTDSISVVSKKTGMDVFEGEKLHNLYAHSSTM